MLVYTNYAKNYASTIYKSLLPTSLMQNGRTFLKSTVYLTKKKRSMWNRARKKKKI